jgi:long-chain fatty acid transport protein
MRGGAQARAHADADRYAVRTMKKTSSLGLWSSVLWLGLSCEPTRVHASPLLEQVGDLGGLGGQQARASATGAAATYFNPALLDAVPVGLTVGVLVLRSELGVRLGERPGSGADVPDGLANASRSDDTRLDSYPIATDVLRNGAPARSFTPAVAPRPRQGAGTGHQTLSYEAIGLVAKAFRQRLTLGFYGLVPNATFMQIRSFYVDEREQYFSNSLHPELYSDRLTALSMAFAAGVKLHKTLAVGVGVTLGFRAGVDAPAFVADASQLQNILLDMSARVKVAVSPHLGVSYRPHPRLHLTGTLHAPQKIELDAKFQFLLATGLQQGSSLKFVQDYQPWQAGAGLSWDIVRQGLRSLALTGTLLYARWSQYLDRHGVRPSGAYQWNDTLAGTLGLRFVGEHVGLSTDVQYKPTPVPLQTGRSNYLDNDRLGMSISAEYRWTWLETPLAVGLQLQAYRMLTREQKKRSAPRSPSGENRTPGLVWDEVPDDAQIASEPVPGRDGLQTNNPGWPGFSSSGWIGSVGTTFSLRF